MVRYDKAHKEQTRESILRAASRLFRERGYNGVGIERIMQEVGLTRGGFYNHFDSKKALFAEVLRWDKDFVDRMKGRPGVSLGKEGIQIAMDYLEPRNRKAVGTGCVLTTLTPDVIRVGDSAGKAFRKTVESLIQEFQRGLEGVEEDDERALVAVALCVGGLLLSRGMDGSPLADRISRACQKAVARELAAR